MSSFEEHFQKALESQEIPGVILLASDAKGKFQYKKAFGPATPSKAMDLDATMIFASCTKLMTSIAAMQCVERALIALDNEVAKVLPELKDPQILTGFTDSGEPIFKKSPTQITLRHLLTHTSGLGYGNMNPIYATWRKFSDHAANIRDGDKGLMYDINLPLIFEPGTSWNYGVSVDWAGVLVSRLNNCSLEQFMENNIWTPLGIKNITFHQELKPDVRKNLVQMTSRNGQEAKYSIPSRDAGKVEWTDEIIYQDPTKDEAGGAGAIGSPLEYTKILQSILSNDGKLLKSETIDEMFRPQLEGDTLKAWNDYQGRPMFHGAFSFQPPGTKMQWGIGGCLTDQDLDTGKKKGTLSWSGLPNLMWTIDREAGLACMYASNVIPFGDYKSGEMQVVFEREMYAMYKKALK